MTSINLLIAASSSISEANIRHQLQFLSTFEASSVSYIESNKSLEGIVKSIFPSANSKKYSATSLVSIRKLIEGCSHLILLWDGEDLSSLLFEARLRKKKTKLITLQVTKVVNKQVTDNYDVYIGRGSPWGNQYAIGHGEGDGRFEVIEKYREFFNEKIATDDSFRNGILAMRGLRLACFCKPAPCHGDVIADYLNNIDTEAA